MSQDNATTAPGESKVPTAKEAMLFYHIITSNKGKLEVDWNQVAIKAGYSNGACASVRFGQVKKRLGLTLDGSTSSASASTTPNKARAKKEVGSGTNTTPSKVTKKRSTVKRAKAAEAEFFNNLADDDELLMSKEEEEEGVDYGIGGSEENGHLDDGGFFYQVQDS